MCAIVHPVIMRVHGWVWAGMRVSDVSDVRREKAGGRQGKRDTGKEGEGERERREGNRRKLTGEGHEGGFAQAHADPAELGVHVVEDGFVGHNLFHA